MREPTKEELLEFMRKNYGEQWATEDKLPLAKILWKKRFGSKYVSTNAKPEKIYKKVKIKDIKEPGSYEVEGIVIDADNFTYLGCPICFKSVKKQCSHIVTGQAEATQLYMLQSVISDGTGELKVSSVWVYEKERDVGLGDLIRVRGTLVKTKNGNGFKFFVDDVEIVKKVSATPDEPVGNNPEVENESSDERSDSKGNVKGEIDDNIRKFLKMTSKFGRVRGDIFESMARKMEIPEWVIEEFYIYEDDGYYILKREAYDLI